MRYATLVIAVAATLTNGCTTVTFTAVRSTFSPDVGVQMICSEVENGVDELNAFLADTARKGRRVAMTGLRVTSFLGLASAKPIVCAEQSLAPDRGTAASADLPAPPRPITSGDERPAPLPPPAPMTGTVGVLSVPAGAEITLDGRGVGRAPLILKDVPAGERRITATWLDGRTATVTMDVPGGKTVTARLAP